MTIFHEKRNPIAIAEQGGMHDPEEISNLIDELKVIGTSEAARAIPNIFIRYSCINDEHIIYDEDLVLQAISALKIMDNGAGNIQQLIGVEQNYHSGACGFTKDQIEERGLITHEKEAIEALVEMGSEDAERVLLGGMSIYWADQVQEAIDRAETAQIIKEATVEVEPEGARL